MLNPDLSIASSIRMHHINDIATVLNISSDDLIHYGKYKAKIPLFYLNKERINRSKLILVTATSPTPAGEGKTTTSIGLALGMNKIDKQTTVVLREPSLGPVFGMKGGAAGGGHAQVLPMEDINLHFTGDLHAIEKAHNLLAAVVDNNLQSKKNNIGLDPRNILWKRVMDMNDRSLRKIVIGLGGTANSIPRESGFDITAASEVMAILCMSQGLNDLKKRLGNILVGFNLDRKPVFAKDLQVEGAMAALLKEAVKPNLVQTTEGTPAIIHGGPFANIAQGTNTILATQMGMSLSDFVVTEAGFGADLGAEKFFNLKCASSGLKPSSVVLVTTVRALKYHGGVALDNLKTPDLQSLEKGFPNLEKHIENLSLYNLPVIVAINAFPDDTENEWKLIQEKCLELGVPSAISKGWELGGEGTIDLAEKVYQSTLKPSSNDFTPLYEWRAPTKRKIETIATKIYGAQAIEYNKEAQKALRRIESLGLDSLGICIAKTQYSFSDNPSLLGRPSGYSLQIRDIEIASGAGFVIPIAGDIMRMPGLPATPSAVHIDIDENGNISGLF
ncbi:MAG TPA: formate--tetrahydrofolate ligase [Saprospiraceae bacterium]|nr:formate--tetrahydrofolate ligase [Saprospiraceae bacterium]